MTAAPTSDVDVTVVDAPTTHAVYTLLQAVAEALSKHPLIRAAQLDRRAADARVDEARFALLPGLGASAQINRSTGNTVPGLFFTTAGIPPIAGPVQGRSLDGGVWQTGVGLWANYDVLSLARQAGAIDVALAQRRALTAQVAVEQLEVAYGAADAFLLLLEAQEAKRAAQAAVDRADTLVKMTRPVVDQSLRPGVDLSRAQAELAGARTTLATAEQTRRVRQANLAVAIGHVGLVIDAAPGDLLSPVDGVHRSVHVSSNPHVVVANEVAERFGAQREVIRAQFLPRVDLVAALFARGTGLSVPGLAASAGDGLVPDVANWAAGLVITWSALDIPTITARARAASADYGAAVARRDDVVLAVSGQLESASAFLDGALRIARETPIALAAARAAAEQALVRYQTALAPIVDVSDAERVLTAADVNDATARIEVHRALLLLARAAGDLGPVLGR